jgi:nucleotide-binding universal stress UspA family protein
MNLAFKAIMVATDFSPPADLALEYARTLAKRFGASLHLVHVVEEPFPIGTEGYVPEVADFRKSVLQDAHQRLTTSLAAIPEGATGEVLIGNPAQRISEAAAEKNADLLVMGTHGRGRMAHVLMGSVAERVLRTAPCPVLTVRETDAWKAVQHARAKAEARS